MSQEVARSLAECKNGLTGNQDMNSTAERFVAEIMTCNVVSVVAENFDDKIDLPHRNTRLRISMDNLGRLAFVGERNDFRANQLEIFERLWKVPFVFPRDVF